MAIMNNIGGNAFIRFTVLANGELEEVTIVNSSGEKVLDDASAKAIERAVPFRPFPETLKKKKIHITANFNYSPTFNPIKTRR